MDFNLSEMQRMLLDSAERFVEDHYSLHHRREMREVPDGLDRAAWASFAGLGWLALAIPEAQGGLGGSLEDVAVLMTAFGRKLVTEPFVSTAVLAVHILAAAASQEALLAAIAGGEALVALAHDEVNERYAYGAPRQTRLAANGNGYTLSGQKMLVMDAPSATHLIVTAALEDEAGTALVLVDAGAEGVASSPYLLVDGGRAADIKFESVAIAPEAVLLAPAQGHAVLAEALDKAGIALMAQSVGAMESCLQICAAYIKERKQFGQPIGKFQALQHIMADMFVATHQSRSALYRALAFAGDPAERAKAASLAKLTIGEASQLVSRQAVQLHGGYGVTDEYEVSHHYRRLLALEKIYGDIDYHTRRLAKAA
jgi:alkylation response protein AidB-like acyl-CoA dehydrogenase